MAIKLRKVASLPLVRIADIWKMSLKIRVGLSILLFLLFLAFILEPLFCYILLKGKNPTAVGAFEPYLSFSFDHPLGTDHLGRDMLVLIIYGFKQSLIIGLLTGTISLSIGLTLALISGYKGGFIDRLITSITDVILVIPLLPIIAILAVYSRRIDLISMCLIMGVLNWPWSTRTIRAQVLSLRERPFIELAKISNLSSLEIIFKEIMPNLLPYIYVGFANSIMAAIFTETGIRLIGVGPPELVTLGLIINFCIAFGYLAMQRYYAIILPILLLTSLFFSLNLINVGLDEVYNPRLKKITGL
jgi:peptide/nickel transport system permease protein